MLTFFSLIATLGLRNKSPRTPQIVGWRKFIKLICWFWFRTMLFAWGVISFRVKGKRAESNEAPLFVVAPHTSIFFDMAPIYLNGGHPVASAHLLGIPFTGQMSRMLDPVYLDRFSKDSKTQAMSIIRERAKASYTQRWKQVLFFPEGLCSNGDNLATFKNGAFVAGLPVQPITLKIKRHGGLNLCAWTQTGTQDLSCNLFQFMKWWQEIEVHYLPPYKPSEEEINDPDLYAYNVQQKMAKYRNMTATDYSVYDARVCARFVMKNNFKHKSGLLGIEPMAWMRNMRASFIVSHVSSSFIDICNYTYKRKEAKKNTERGDGHINPSVNVMDVANFYGLKRYQFVRDELVQARNNSIEYEFNKQDATRKLPNPLYWTTELTSRQYCEVICDLTSQSGAYEPDEQFLTKFAQQLEPKFQAALEDYRHLQAENYDIFDEEVAKTVAKSVSKFLGKTFCQYIHEIAGESNILSEDRVEQIFYKYCVKKIKHQKNSSKKIMFFTDEDEFDEGDYSWATDYVAIAEKFKSVVRHAPLYYVLIKKYFPNLE